MTSTCVISFNSQYTHHPHSHFVDEENKDWRGLSHSCTVTPLVKNVEIAPLFWKDALLALAFPNSQLKHSRWADSFCDGQRVA